MYCKFRIRRNFIIASTSEQFWAEVLITQKKEIVAYKSSKFSKVQYKYSTYDSQLVAFFKNIEATDIFSYFNKEELILNQYKRPRLRPIIMKFPVTNDNSDLGYVMRCTSIQGTLKNTKVLFQTSAAVKQKNTRPNFGPILCSEFGVYGKRGIMSELCSDVGAPPSSRATQPGVCEILQEGLRHPK